MSTDICVIFSNGSAPSSPEGQRRSFIPFLNTTALTNAASNAASSFTRASASSLSSFTTANSSPRSNGDVSSNSTGGYVTGNSDEQKQQPATAPVISSSSSSLLRGRRGSDGESGSSTSVGAGARGFRRQRPPLQRSHTTVRPPPLKANMSVQGQLMDVCRDCKKMVVHIIRASRVSLALAPTSAPADADAVAAAAAAGNTLYPAANSSNNSSKPMRNFHLNLKPVHQFGGKHK